MSDSWHVGQQWGLDLEQVWSRATTGSGLHVAILDSGVATVAGLSSPRVYQRDLSGQVVYSRDRRSDSHGTKVASALASDDHSAIGVAPGLSVSCIDVYGPRGPLVPEVAAAIRTAVDELKVDAICCTFTFPQVSNALIDQLEHAHRNKVPILVSAGDPTGCDFPARGQSVISVAASGMLKQAVFGALDSTIAAPGVTLRVRATGAGVSTFTGTSAAAPVATGIVALALAYARTKGVEVWLRDNLGAQLHGTGSEASTASAPPIINALALLDAIDEQSKK